MIDGAKEIWRSLSPRARICLVFLAAFLVIAGVMGAYS